MKNCKIVMSGVSSEYVLSGLAAFLKKRGYEVVELDFAIYNDDPKLLLLSLRDQNTIYITSAHINFSRCLAKYIVPGFPKKYPNYLAPIEIIPQLNPKKTIYIPHDLLSPYGESNLSEIRLLDLFNHVLASTEQEKNILRSTLPSTTQVHHAGWIKYTNYQNKPSNNTIKNMLFISIIGHLQERYGIEGIVKYFKPLLTKDITLKFPAWKDVEKLEQAIKENTNAKVIPSTKNSIELIKQAEIVICNAVSSIHVESALMGKPTICLLDKEGISMYEQREKLQYFPNIYFHDYSKRKPIPSAFLDELRNTQKEPLLKPFDYEMVLQIIEGDVAPS